MLNPAKTKKKQAKAKPGKLFKVRLGAAEFLTRFTIHLRRYRRREREQKKYKKRKKRKKEKKTENPYR